MKRLFRLTVIALGVTSLVLANTGCRRNKANAKPVEPILETDGGIPDIDPNAVDPLSQTGFEGLPQRGGSEQYLAVPGLEPVYFDYDRSDLRGSEQTKVDNAAAYFRSNSGLFVMVEGHTDERGSNEYNLGLGERRAMAIRDALIQRGIEAGRIQTLSKGEEFPAVMGRDDSAWSRNRRGEFLAGQ